MQYDIKKLEWNASQNTSFGVKTYWISEHLGCFFILYDGLKISQHGSMDRAKEKAQEHFEKQVMQFLYVSEGT